MSDQHYDQENSEFFIFDDCDHDDDDWLDFYEQSPSFHCFQFDLSSESNIVSSTISTKDSNSIEINQNPMRSQQIQKIEPNHENHPIRKTKRPKTKIILTPDAEQFRRRLYRLLTNGEKKVVRKEYIFLFHSLIRENYPNIRDVRRDEYRSIGNYFNNFAQQQHFILYAIRQLKKTMVPRFNNYF